MKFSRQEFIQPYHYEIHGLDQNCVNFAYFQVSRPIPTPPQIKNLQLVEFQPTSAIAHNRPFKHIQAQILSHSTLEKLVPSIRMEE